MNGRQIALQMKAAVDKTKMKPNFFYLFAVTVVRSLAL